MLIWILMAVGLVIIVTGGFVGKNRRDRYRQAAPSGTHRATHHGKGARRSRRARPPLRLHRRSRPVVAQVGRSEINPVTLSLRIIRRSSALNSLSSTR